MKKQNNYDGSIIYNELQKDIKREKTMIFISGFTFFVLLMVIIPMAFGLFFGLLFYADLPFFDHNLAFAASNTRFFLLPYNILLIFYFVVMYYKDKKLHLVNEEHFKKSIRYFVLALGVAILPFIFTNHILLTVIYFVFFILTIYHLSFTYYDIELQKAHNIHSHLYRSEDLGWMSSMGIIDNPFSIKDDINRAKGFVQVSTLGFDFIILFVNMIVKSIVFSYGIRYKNYVQESARLFDFILEEDLDIENSKFSVPSKVILESLSYVSFRDGKIVLYEHGDSVSKLAKIKEQI